MTYCSCCGQALDHASRGRNSQPARTQRPHQHSGGPNPASPLVVDGELLASVRHAREIAAMYDAPEINIAHLVVALGASSSAERAGQAVGGDVAALAAQSSYHLNRTEPRFASGAAASSAARAMPSSNSARAPLLSDELDLVLARSEEHALHVGRGVVTFADLLIVLLNHVGDLPSARFLSIDPQPHTNAIDQFSEVQHRGLAAALTAQPRPLLDHSGDPFQLRTASPLSPTAPHQTTDFVKRPVERARDDDTATDRRHDPAGSGQSTARSRAAASHHARAGQRHTRSAHPFQLRLNLIPDPLQARSTGAPSDAYMPALNDHYGARSAAARVSSHRRGAGGSGYQSPEPENGPLAVQALESRLAEMQNMLAELMDEASVRRARTEIASLSQTAASGVNGSDAHAAKHRSSAAATSRASAARSADTHDRDPRPRDGYTEASGAFAKVRQDTQWSARSGRQQRPLTRAWRANQTRSRSRFAARRDHLSAKRVTWPTEPFDDDLAPRDHTSNLPVGRDDAQHHEGDPNAKRFYLSIDDEIVKAPSIGPRTAERLTPHGIHTVRDLFAADPVDLAERIGARHITVARIEDWQIQARLVCTIPWLRGTHAQLLVGAGYTSPGDIQSASIDQLSADILMFAATRDGQRILRDGDPPDIEKIIKWADYASLAELDRAA